MNVTMKPIADAPKDGTTIIVTGGWYEWQGQRMDNAPSLVAWNGEKWVMQDDYRAEYNEPQFWTDVP